MRADQLGDDAAALDIADEDDRNARRLGEAHIGDVARAQVDLGRAAGTLDQHEVRALAEVREAREHARQQRRAQALIFPRGLIAEHAAVHDHLRARLDPAA